MTETWGGMTTKISGGETKKKNENLRKIRREMMKIIVRRKKRSRSEIVRMTIGRKREKKEKREKRNIKSHTNLVVKTDTRRSLKRDRRGVRGETGLTGRKMI